MTPTLAKRLRLSHSSLSWNHFTSGASRCCCGCGAFPFAQLYPPPPAAGCPTAWHVKVIHPTRLPAHEGRLIGQGPINRLKKGRANEERDLPSRRAPRSHHENLICSDVPRTSAARQLEINCRHYPPRWFMILVYVWRDLRRRLQWKLPPKSCLYKDRLTVMLMVTATPLITFMYPFFFSPHLNLAADPKSDHCAMLILLFWVYVVASPHELFSFTQNFLKPFAGRRFFGGGGIRYNWLI